MTDPAMGGGAPPAGGMGAPGMQLASYGDRFLAFLIDFGVLIVIGIVFGILQFIIIKLNLGIVATLLSLLNMVVNIGYFIYLWGFDNPLTEKGQTIGKKVMKIKIVKVDGQELGPVDAVLRYIGYAVSSFVILLGYVWIFVDDQNQGWHDKIAKTLVVKIG